MKFTPIRGSICCLIFYFFALSFSVQAATVYELKGSQTITVRLDNGEDLVLKAGALVSLNLSSSGWAYDVQVLRTETSATIQAPKRAKIGKQSFNDYLQSGLLERKSKPNSTAQQTPLRPRYTIQKKGEVQFIGESGTFYLDEGDSFELVVNTETGWKQEVVITKSSDPKRQGLRAAIGKVFLNSLIDSSHIVVSNQSVTSPSVSRVTSQTQKPKTISTELDPAALCPESGRYKVERNFFYNLANGEQQDHLPLTIPAGSQVQITESSDESRCQFSFISSPDGVTGLEGRELLTYPTNFQNRNLMPLNTASGSTQEALNFERGAKFVLTTPDGIDLIEMEKGLRSSAIAGAPFEVLDQQNEMLILKGEDGRRYRVDKESLLDARDQGELYFDTEGSFALTLDNLINPSLISTPMPCLDEVRPPLVRAHNNSILWESCRERARATSGGRTLAANNHYDQLIRSVQRFGNQDSARVLADQKGSEISECIMHSLKGGTNHNAHPHCQRSPSGELIPSPIRKSVRKTNSHGKSYSTIQILNPVPKACASELTSTFLADNFLKAMNCLGLDPKEVFPLINHESHFQPGAVSPTGALSVGQTVATNYLEIYKNLAQAKNIIHQGGERLIQQRRFSRPEIYRTQYENASRKAQTRMTTIFVAKLEEQIKNPSAHGCMALKKMLDEPLKIPAGKNPIQHVIDTENKRLCPPNQPEEAFLMAGIDYIANKKYSESLIGDWEAKLPAGKRMSASEREEIIKILARWMYNGGQSGMASTFEFFMEELTMGRVSQRDRNLNPVSRNGQRQIISDRSLKSLGPAEFKKYMSAHVMQKYPGSQGRKSEVAGYIQKMDRDLEQIEKRGLSCGK